MNDSSVELTESIRLHTRFWIWVFSSHMAEDREVLKASRCRGGKFLWFGHEMTFAAREIRLQPRVTGGKS